VESNGYDEVNFPGSRFHVVIPLGSPASEEEKGKELKLQAN